MKVVINNCYGGFSLSYKAIYYLVKKGSDIIEKMSIKEYTGGDRKTVQDIIKRDDWREFNNYNNYYHDNSIPVLFKGEYSYSLKDDYDTNIRTHPDLIEVVSILKDDANGTCAELKIVDIPDNVKFTIEEYDGSEHIAEVHRTWC